MKFLSESQFLTQLRRFYPVPIEPIYLLKGERWARSKQTRCLKWEGEEKLSDFGSAGIPACLVSSSAILFLRFNRRKVLDYGSDGSDASKAGRDACAPVHELITVESLILEVL